MQWLINDLKNQMLVMRKYLVVVFLFFSLSALAQFTKQSIEKDFPKLKLPFDNKGMLFSINSKAGMLNPAEVKFVKGEITNLINKYKDGVLIVNEAAKHYAIGRIVFGDKNYILYLESSVNEDTNIGVNEMFVVSLKNDYQPIQSQSISYYYQTFLEFKLPAYQLVETIHHYGEISEINNQLNLKITQITQKDKMPQDVNIEKRIDIYEYIFDEYGILIYK